MTQRKKPFRELERYITLGLILSTIIFIAFLVATGTGNVWLKVIYTILALGICAYCLWLLWKTRELLRRRSFWMTVWAGAIVICIIASLILNYPSPNLYG